MSNIRDVNAKKFVWNNIVTRFGIPHTLIFDNEIQFDSKAFRRYCCKLDIRNRHSTPAYPQGNEQAEAVTKVIVSGFKKSLDEAKGRWVEELPYALDISDNSSSFNRGNAFFYDLWIRGHDSLRD